MSEIILGGVKLSDIRAAQQAMKKDAMAFVSENVKLGRELFEQLMALSEDAADQVDALAEEALKKFSDAKLVSDVTGISYYLPFSEGGDWYDEAPYSYRLEYAGEDGDDGAAVSGDWTTSVSKLFDLLGNMEVKSRDWHSSRC